MFPHIQIGKFLISRGADVSGWLLLREHLVNLPVLTWSYLVRIARSTPETKRISCPCKCIILVTMSTGADDYTVIRFTTLCAGIAGP